MRRWFPAGVYDTKHLSGKWQADHDVDSGGRAALGRGQCSRVCTGPAALALAAPGTGGTCSTHHVPWGGMPPYSGANWVPFWCLPEPSPLADRSCAGKLRPELFEDTSLGPLHDGLCKGQVGWAVAACHSGAKPPACPCPVSSALHVCPTNSCSLTCASLLPHRSAAARAGWRLPASTGSGSGSGGVQRWQHGRGRGCGAACCGPRPRV